LVIAKMIARYTTICSQPFAVMFRISPAAARRKANTPSTRRSPGA
jgi:hypothetical protein